MATAVLVVALAVLVVPRIAPRVARIVGRAFDRAMEVVQRALTLIILGGFYLLVFAPIALARRILGRDPLAIRADRDVATYWQTIQRIESPHLEERQFIVERTDAAARSGVRRFWLFGLLRSLGRVALVAVVLDLTVGRVAQVEGSRAARFAALRRAKPSGQHAVAPWRTVVERVFDGGVA
jgi:hypothetical protein